MSNEPPEGAPESQLRLLAYLHELGAAARTVELAPHSMLRKSGVLATPEAVARVHADLRALEVGGQLIQGEVTASGVMVMLITAGDLPVLLTCERLVTMFSWLNEHERHALSRWERDNLAIGGPSTSDWPGWPTIYRRRRT